MRHDLHLDPGNTGRDENVYTSDDFRCNLRLTDAEWEAMGRPLSLTIAVNPVQAGACRDCGMPPGAPCVSISQHPGEVRPRTHPIRAAQAAARPRQTFDFQP